LSKKLNRLIHSKIEEILEFVPIMIKQGDKEINATTPLIDKWVLRLQLKKGV